MAAPLRKRAACSCAGSAQTNFAALLAAPYDGLQTGSQAELVVYDGCAGLLADYAPVYAIKLVRTGAVGLKNGPIVSSPRQAANLLHPFLSEVDREHFVVLLLDAKNRAIGISTISVGDLFSTLVHPREVFKPAILANAASVLLAHNHPSGDPTPSPEDVAVTRRLGEAGELLGISIVDHVVLGEPGRWVSLRERGLYYGDLTSSSKVAQTQYVLGLL